MPSKFLHNMTTSTSTWTQSGKVLCTVTKHRKRGYGHAELKDVLFLPTRSQQKETLSLSTMDWACATEHQNPSGDILHQYTELPNKEVRVKFVNEKGLDGGGLLRELFTLFCSSWRAAGVASFPGPHCFHVHEERRGPGIFSHMCYVKSRKDLIECGRTGAQNSNNS